MDDWVSFISKIDQHLEKIDVDFPLFRGHNEKSWKLTPSLFRVTSNYSTQALEDTLYADFKSNCGPLYDRELNSWEILFEMRHSGLPTRLLDWTEHFSSAIFFALRDIDWEKNENEYQPCIWILDPYALNKKFYTFDQIVMVEDLGFEYDDLIGDEKNLDAAGISGPIVFLTPRSQQRIFAQKSVFSLHDIKFQSIDQICKNCVKRFDIPLNCIPQAQQFLFLSGTNEYSLYPDLDGLGRLLKDRHNIKPL